MFNLPETCLPNNVPPLVYWDAGSLTWRRSGGSGQVLLLLGTHYTLSGEILPITIISLMWVSTPQAKDTLILFS